MAKREIWTREVPVPRFSHLEGDAATDVLVIGGGMAGVLCARELQARGVDCLLVEGRQLGCGITKGTTAVLSAQHDTLYQDLVSDFGEETARLYLRANLDALDRLRELARRYPCDWEERPSFLYAQTPAQAVKLQQEAALVQRLGWPAEYREAIDLPFPTAGAVCFPGMAQFHPLKFLYEVARSLNVREGTFVRRIEDGAAVTDRGRISARVFVIATHFPFRNGRGLYFLKLYQSRSYVVALRGGPQLEGTYTGMGDGGMFLRNYRDCLLVGGGDHRTGTKSGGFQAVRDFAHQWFPGLEEVAAWGNQDCMSLDGVPYIGPYSPKTPHMYTATGFGGWGMTTSMAAASLLADQILGKENPYSRVFSPSRSMWRPQLLSNLGATLSDFVIPTVKRCPHMGCALRWNPAEHSWDCPCHGSRFSEDGRLRDNPATRDADV